MKPLSEARLHLYNALDWIRVGEPDSARERIQEAVYILEDHDHVLTKADVGSIMPSAPGRGGSMNGLIFGVSLCTRMREALETIEDERTEWGKRTCGTRTDYRGRRDFGDFNLTPSSAPIACNSKSSGLAGISL